MSRSANLAERLLGVAERAACPALVEPGRSWTYGELAERVARVGGALLELGVEPGDRVAVMMPDCLEAAASILGAVWVGAVAVPTSELLRPNDVRALIRDSGAKIAIVHGSLEPIFDEVRPEMSALREVVVVGGTRGAERSFEAVLAAAKPAPVSPVKPTDPAFIIYSVGVGDVPKGILHSHLSPMAAYDAFGRQVLGMTESDRVLATVKLATAFGLGAGLIFPLAAGCASVLLPQQPRSTMIFDALRDLKPTLLFGTPSLYGQLLSDADKLSGQHALEGLRLCVAGGEAMPASLAERLIERLSVKVLSTYGLTEAFHTVLACRLEAGRPGSVGKLVPGYEARVVNEEGEEVPTNEIGRLMLRGASMAIGYWGRPDESAATFGEWMRTGDRFLVDGDGFFFHCGRADGLFKVGGKWVAPAEVEHTLLAHEAVWECAVVGMEDEDGLTKPFAFVVPNVGHAPGVELERQLIEYVKREIAPYKYPRWIEFVSALPKGANGKVLRYKLRPRARPRRRSAGAGSASGAGPGPASS